MITYNPLWSTLINKGMTKTELRVQAGFSTGTLARMGKGQYIEMKHIESICLVLECDIEDVVRVVRDN